MTSFGSESGLVSGAGVGVADSIDDKVASNFLKSPAPAGAAISKIFAASIGDMVLVLSRSPAHKHFSLSDIEWMVLPPASVGQFYVAEVADEERGLRAPIALITWAYVSTEVDARLHGSIGQALRLLPDEWNSGDIAWLIDAAGDAIGVGRALYWLAAGPFKERDLKMIVQRVDGARTVNTLAHFLAERAAASKGS